MSILHAIILGAIQGVAEFLPISSSGHLVIIPYIFNWKYQGLDFDIAVHMGTVIALLAFFWRDWLIIISNAISPKSDVIPASSSVIPAEVFRKVTLWAGIHNSYPKNLFWILAVSTIPAAIGGYFLENLAAHALRNPLLIAILLAVFGLLLWLADSASQNNQKIKDIGYIKGLVIGIAQVVALFPGVSRSGITTTAGMFLNLDRRAATRFSFLLSTPAILGAFLLSLRDYSGVQINLSFFIAIFTSAVFGYFAIKYLLKFLEKHGFGPFIIYRFAMAALVAIIYFTR